MTEERPMLRRDALDPSGFSPRQVRFMDILNWTMFGIHSSTAVALAILVPVLQRDKTEPWYSYLSPTTPRLVANFPIGALTPFYLMLAAANHLICVTCYRKVYFSNLRQRCHPLRWAEYIFSVPLMHLQVAEVSGVADVHLLFLLLGLAAITVMFGHLSEQASLVNRILSTEIYIWGLVPFLYGWAVVLCYFFHGVVSGSPPDFLFAIVFVVFILDLWTALVLLLQIYRFGWFESMLVSEMSFTILSLVAKQTLAWVLFGGLNK